MSALPSLLNTVDLQSATAAQTALRVFFRLAAEWKLSPAEQMQLLAVPRATYYQWKKGRVAPLDRDKLARLSYLFGIYKALQILFPTPDRAARWVRAPNSAPIFNGQSALERMLAGQMSDLQIVRQYLDAQCEGWA